MHFLFMRLIHSFVFLQVALIAVQAIIIGENGAYMTTSDQRSKISKHQKSQSAKSSDYESDQNLLFACQFHVEPK